MTKIVSYLFAALLTLGIMGSSLQTADAGKRERRIAAGVAIGLLGIAAVASHKRRKSRNRYYNDSYYEDDGYSYAPRYSRRNYRKHVRKNRRYRSRHYRSCHSAGARFDCSGSLNEK